jgi:hypothetical protein
VYGVRLSSLVILGQVAEILQLFDAGICFPVADDPAKMLLAVRKLGIEPVRPVYQRRR